MSSRISNLCLDKLIKKDSVKEQLVESLARIEHLDGEFYEYAKLFKEGKELERMLTRLAVFIV